MKKPKKEAPLPCLMTLAMDQSLKDLIVLAAKKAQMETGPWMQCALREAVNAHAGLVEALASCVTVLTIADQIGGPSSAVRANILRDAHAALAAANSFDSAIEDFYIRIGQPRRPKE